MRNKGDVRWGQLFDRAIGKSWFDEELKAKNEARNQVRELVISKGYEDLEKAECPEDEVDSYCRIFDVWFDEHGNITRYSNW